LKYRNHRIAEAVIKAITPDNVNLLPETKIESNVKKNNVNIHIQSKRGIASLITTLDDILTCIQVAEKTLSEL
jgi:hypothetical protein